ncbi:MAG: hypothetical protein JXC36_09690 [Candidatus Atribacteria bacterium]|nr:hypothetical protein [Candidatus Atribacteria bacterium]
MKKITYLFSVLLVLSFLYSCDKQMADEINVGLKEAYVEADTTPISTNGIVPVVLHVDKPRGGNVTCADVEEVFKVSYFCGDKINYDDYATEEDFENAFPAWLQVKVEGIYISFNIDGCGDLDGVHVKVGAVIVKGSNSSGVYYYPNGSIGDSHLAAPGDKYMVSNLTFCFVACEQPPQKVIAFKAYSSSYQWTCSGGGPENDYFIGPYDFVSGASYKTWWYGKEYGDISVGNLSILDLDSDGKLEVVVDNYDKTAFKFLECYLYVGAPEGFTTTYMSYPYQRILTTAQDTVVFQLPF